jgi:hypothetical protein
MALDFPANPVNGEVFGSYVWSASKGVWQSREESATVAITSPTAPLSANNGDLWYDTNRGVTYVYYNDGSSSQWVEVVTSGTPELSTKANLSGGNTFSGVQTLNTPLAIASGGTGANALSGAQANLQMPISENYLINSAFDFWQRGTSIGLNNATGFTADRWCLQTANNTTTSRQLSSLANFRYCGRIQRNSGSTSTTAISLGQPIETSSSIPLAGKTVTLSWYARAGANYSALGSVLSMALATGTGTDQNRLITGYTGDTVVINNNYTLTTSWQRFTATATLPSNTNEITVNPYFVPVGTAGVNDWFEITGVQLEEGTTATPFRRNQSNIQAELAACQRYFEKSFPIDFAPQNGPNTTSFATTQGLLAYVSGNSMQAGFLTFSVPKRISNPIMTAFGNSSGQTRYRDSSTSATDLWSAAALQFTATSERGVLLQQNVVNNVVIPVQGHWTANAEL